MTRTATPTEDQITGTAPQRNEGSRSVTKAEVDNQFKDFRNIIIAVVVVLTVAFITLLVTVAGMGITYLHDNNGAYTDYRNELRSQNEKIDALTIQLKIKEQTQVTPTSTQSEPAPAAQ